MYPYSPYRVYHIDERLWIAAADVAVLLDMEKDSISDLIYKGRGNWIGMKLPSNKTVLLVSMTDIAEKYRVKIEMKVSGGQADLTLVAQRQKCWDIVQASKSENDDYNVDIFKDAKDKHLPNEERTKAKEGASVVRACASDIKSNPHPSNSMIYEKWFDYIKFRGLKLPCSNRLWYKWILPFNEGADPSMLILFQRRGAPMGNDNAQVLGKLGEALIVERMKTTGVKGAEGNKFPVTHVVNHLKSDALIVLESDVASEEAKRQAAKIVNVSLRTVQLRAAVTKGYFEKDRHGDKNFMLKRELVINQRTASQPNLQWESDGTLESYWYYDSERKTIGKLEVILVRDAHTRLIMGYSFGDTENAGLALEAFKMACKFYGVVPKRFRTDKGPGFNNAETKQVLANFGVTWLPSKAGRARARRLEPEWQRIREKVGVYYENKSSGNVDVRSIENKQNPDTFKSQWQSYPSRDELVIKLAEMYEMWNECRIESRGSSPREIYRTTKNGGKKITELELIDGFFVWHKQGSKLKSRVMTAEGIEFQLQKKNFKYLPAVNTSLEMADFMNTHQNTTLFFIKYDPSDLTQIALYTVQAGKPKLEEYMRFECYALLKGTSAEYLPEATEEEKENYRFFRAVQKNQHDSIELDKEERLKVLADAGIIELSVNGLAGLNKENYNAAKKEVQKRLMTGGLENKPLPERRAAMSSTSTIKEEVVTTDIYSESELFENSITDAESIYNLDPYS